MNKASVFMSRHAVEMTGGKARAFVRDALVAHGFIVEDMNGCLRNGELFTAEHCKIEEAAKLADAAFAAAEAARAADLRYSQFIRKI